MTKKLSEKERNIEYEENNIQIITYNNNYFDIKTKKEYISIFINKVIRLPANKSNNDFFIYVPFSRRYYEILIDKIIYYKKKYNKFNKNITIFSNYINIILKC